MSVSIVFARALAAEFDKRRLDSESLLDDCGIAPSRLLDLRDKLSFEHAARLIHQAVRRSGDPGIGLAVGANAPLNMLQLLSHLVLSQRTLRDAFTTFSRYSALVSRGPTFHLTEHGDVASWVCIPPVPPCETTRVLTDYGVTLASRIGRALRAPDDCGGDSPLLAARFQHAEPSYAARYREVYCCPVLFEQSWAGLDFRRELLDRPQYHSDARMSAMLREQAEQLLTETGHEDSWSERVRRALQYESQLADATIESIARQLHLSERALRRRLEAEGHSFSALFDEARRRVACDYLRRTDVSIQGVADLLGFSEASAFYRAFKRWTGMTPAHYRDQRLAESS